MVAKTGKIGFWKWLYKIMAQLPPFLIDLWRDPSGHGFMEMASGIFVGVGLLVFLIPVNVVLGLILGLGTMALLLLHGAYVLGADDC